MYDDNNMKQAIGYFESVKGESIKVLGLDDTEIDGKDEIFIIVDFRNEIHNLLLQTKVFNQGESPYESGDIKKVPYFVIESNVYYLDDVFEINSNLEE